MYQSMFMFWKCFCFGSVSENLSMLSFPTCFKQLGASCEREKHG
jgi:hypothetical protein